MAISSKTFDSMSDNENIELLDFFIKNKDQAFSLPILKEQFGDAIIYDLLTLAMNNKITTKTDKRNPNNEVIYFWLNPKSLLQFCQFRLPT